MLIDKIKPLEVEPHAGGFVTAPVDFGGGSGAEVMLGCDFTSVTPTSSKRTAHVHGIIHDGESAYPLFTESIALGGAETIKVPAFGKGMTFRIEVPPCDGVPSFVALVNEHGTVR